MTKQDARIVLEGLFALILGGVMLACIGALVWISIYHWTGALLAAGVMGVVAFVGWIYQDAPSQ